MSDFVAEIRPRQVPLCPVGAGLFTDFSPKSLDKLKLTNYGTDFHPQDISDKEVQNILSVRHFSRDSIVSLIERSVISLVDKLLTTWPVSQIDGTICISMSNDEKPLTIRLLQTFHKPHNVTDSPPLHRNLNIKLKERDHMIACPGDDRPSVLPTESVLSSPKNVEQVNCGLGLEPGPIRNSETLSSSSDCEVSEDSPLLIVSSPSPDQTVVGAGAEDNEPNDRQHGDSDSESGYISNEKEGSETPSPDNDVLSTRGSSPPRETARTFTDYFCREFDGKASLYTPSPSIASDTSQERNDSDCFGSSEDGSDETNEDQDDDYFHHRLVIDENPAKYLNIRNDDKFGVVNEQSTKENGDLENMEEDNGPCGRTEQHQELKQEAIGSINSDRRVDAYFAGGAYSCNADVSGDHLGNNAVASDEASVMPHPQSLVSKHGQGFKCRQCSRVLTNAKAVSRHAQLVHDLYCCSYCCRTFTAKNNLKRHVRLHTGYRPYKCSQCSQTFTRRDDLKGHVLRHNYSKPFRCSICRKGYTDRACIKNHMAKQHRSRLTLVCPRCGESFDRDQSFTAHKQSHTELKQFSCTTCSFIGTNRLITLKHQLLHTRTLFSCKPCNAYFADPFDYTNHVKKHKNSGFSHYKCCFCETVLSTYEQYMKHEYSHAQDKTHTCKTCKKQFRSKSLLQDHVLVHKQTERDKDHTDQLVSEKAEVDTFLSAHWQSLELKDRNSLYTNHDQPFVQKLSAEPYNLSTHACSPLSTVERNVEEFHGELLDLSMKKPSSPTYNNGVASEGTGRRSTCLGDSRFTQQNISRNGAVRRESLDPSREHYHGRHTSDSCLLLEAEGRGHVAHKPVIRSRDEGLNIFVFNPVAQTVRVTHAGKSATENDLPSSIRFPARRESMETARHHTRAPEAVSEQKIMGQSKENGDTNGGALRFAPYNRDKMADLAAKFIAARGRNFIGHKGQQKTVTGTEAGVKEAVSLKENQSVFHNQLFKEGLLNWQLTGSRKNKGRLALHEEGINKTCHDQDEAMCESSNQETALKCHIPTVIKPEPNKELDAHDRPSLFGLVDGSAKNGHYRDNPRFTHDEHKCETCKEDFGSFDELESHSVDVHKRYLCQHCGKSFTARPNRDRHVRYHTGERPYSCDLCDKAFFRGDDLKYHRTTRHPTAQPFVCSRCSASFTWSRDLERHIRHSKC